jgi:hypothetical protein
MLSSFYGVDCVAAVSRWPSEVQERYCCVFDVAVACCYDLWVSGKFFSHLQSLVKPFASSWCFHYCLRLVLITLLAWGQ